MCDSLLGAISHVRVCLDARRSEAKARSAAIAQPAITNGRLSMPAASKLPFCSRPRPAIPQCAHGCPSSEALACSEADMR